MVTTVDASAAGSSAISLVDDAGGAALFSSAGLSPGRVESACVGLTASGSVDPVTEVALNADVTSGGLSPYLRMWVERGTVPPGGTCGAFSGAVLWSGTLDQFPATGTRGIATGWRPAVTQRSVYRFTVTVLDDPRAASLSSSATFRWAFTEAAPRPPAPVPPTTTPPTTPAPVPPTTAPPATAPSTTTPSTTAPSTTTPSTTAPSRTDPTTPKAPRTTGAPTPPSAGPSETSDSGAPAVVTTDPTPPAPPAADPVPTATDGGDERVVEAPVLEDGPAAAVQAALEVAGQVVAGVSRTAKAVATNGQYPLLLIALVTAFLVLQGRLDRRDPKLALARVREELSEYRDFPERPTSETT